MDHVFRSLSNEKVVDLVPYLREKLSESNNISIYIGCDSHNVMNKTIYACVIVLHYGNNGGHVLYTRVKFDRIRDTFIKLYREVEIAMEVAMYLEKHGIRAKFIDIDLNPDPRYRSNYVLRAAMGFVESMGYTPRCKPYAIAASCIADKLCK
jgi:predicted RNase H-related nuclease YkuK (DUF458 family)